MFTLVPGRRCGALARPAAAVCLSDGYASTIRAFALAAKRSSAYCNTSGARLRLRHGRADQLRLYVSNNDQTIRVFALGAMRPLARILTPTPSNYCALAPGGGLLACVGDTPDHGAPAVYLYRPTPAGVAFATLEKVPCSVGASSPHACARAS